MRLGAIARRYLPNCYGLTTSPLHGGMPTDRLIAEWWLDSPRVNHLLSGNAPEIPAHTARVEVRIPAEMPRLRTENPAEAMRLQSDIRGEFQNWLAKGYAATAIQINDDGGRYLLEPWNHLPESAQTK
jgi:predicted GNAT superfamily acetyltransferase